MSSSFYRRRIKEHLKGWRYRTWKIGHNTNWQVRPKQGSRIRYGSSLMWKPVKLSDDVKQGKQKRPANNNQTPARASRNKEKYHTFLHRGKPRITFTTDGMMLTRACESRESRGRERSSRTFILLQFHHHSFGAEKEKDWALVDNLLNGKVPQSKAPVATEGIKFTSTIRLWTSSIATDDCNSWTNSLGRCILFNNYSSSPNRLWVNSPWGRRPNGLLIQRLWGREE